MYQPTVTTSGLFSDDALSQNTATSISHKQHYTSMMYTMLLSLDSHPNGRDKTNGMSSNRGS